MLKRLSLIVLVLGLTFLVAGPVLADLHPLDGVSGPWDVRTGFMKNVVRPEKDVSALQVEAVSGDVPLGKALDVCADIYGRSQYYLSWDFFAEGETYFAYQDPENACVAPYTFEVTSGRTLIASDGLGGPIPLHCELWTVDLTDPACPVPGAPFYVGPSMIYNAPGNGSIELLDVPLAQSPYDIACVDGPYYIAFVFEAGFGPDVTVGPRLSDDESASGGQYCIWYADWTLPDDLVSTMEFYWGLTLDFWFWSEGRTTDQNECHVPGICGWEWKHCVWNNYSYYRFSVPSVSGMRDEIFQTWNAATPCTLLAVDQYMSDPAVIAGDPGLRVSIWSDDGAGAPDVELAYEEIASASIVGGFNTFTFPAFQPLIMQQGTFHVKLSRASWAGDGDSIYIALDDPLTGGCDTPEPCATNFIANAANGYAITNSCVAYGADFELFTELYMCCAAPKTETACTTPGPDTWFTYGHDYGRTSASNMELGVPCDIELAWSANTLNADMRFNNVSVAGGRVFCSDDQTMLCYDLASGALLWSYQDQGNLITGGSMRNNPTIYDGYVYGAGGSFQSIIKLDTLGALQWFRGYNSFGGTTADWLCDFQRFGVTAVADMGPDRVVFTGDQGGCFWALDDVDGSNWANWATNPVQLPDGGAIYHAPAFDGTNLYVATTAGAIYSIDAATGAINWTYNEADGDGYWGGCSYDATEGMVYASTYNNGGDTPTRVKLDAATGVEVWSFGQGRNLYASPTIGRKKVYFAQRDGGLLIVNKESGFAEYNFSSDGVGGVDVPVTLTCDNYLFAGDENGVWSLLDAANMERVWFRQFGDWVWGTALAYHDIEDKEYAVMSIWSDFNTGYALGGIYAWDLNATPRPMMEQLVTETTVSVPLGTGVVVGETVPEVFSNLAGCADLNLGPLTPLDNPPTQLKSATTASKVIVTRAAKENIAGAEEASERLVGTDYLSFFNDDGSLTKHGLMAGKAPLEEADVEGINTRLLQKARYESSKTRVTNLAASAQTLRTSNVALDVPGPVAGGSTVGLVFDYDGTGLERGTEDDYIEVVHDDPDFTPEDGTTQPPVYVTIHYVGGCAFEWHEFLYFNGYDAWRTETVSNFGALADGDVDELGLDWADGINGGTNSHLLYDGGFFIFQDPAVLGASYVQADFYSWDRRFLPNPAPYSGVCGIDYQDYIGGFGRSVYFDWYAGGACPPVLNEDYVDVDLEFTAVQYVDTLEAVPTALGLVITETEIGSYDLGTGYGDFKLLHYKVEQRDNTAPMTDMYAGNFCDWDVGGFDQAVLYPDGGSYAQWDNTSPTVAFGMVMMPGYASLTNSAGVQADYKLCWAVTNHYRIYPSTCTECSFFDGSPPSADLPGDINFPPFIMNYNGTGYDPEVATEGDKSGVIAIGPFDIPGAGDGAYDIYMAMIGIDATSNDPATITAGLESITYRVNKWAGFARGDVNDDGVVDAIDVAYLDAYVASGLTSPLIFPYDDNGDVNLDATTDAGDVAYLLDYLMGGAAPLGEWRFPFMP